MEDRLDLRDSAPERGAAAHAQAAVPPAPRAPAHSERDRLLLQEEVGVIPRLAGRRSGLDGGGGPLEYTEDQLPRSSLDQALPGRELTAEAVRVSHRNGRTPEIRAHPELELPVPEQPALCAHRVGEVGFVAGGDGREGLVAVLLADGELVG